MKILLINAYSVNNRGDAGIVVSTINQIKKNNPASQITVMSSYHNENINFYENYNVKSVNNIWTLTPTKSTIRKYLEGFLILNRLFLKKEVDNSKYYKEADLVISVGGGYLYSSKKGPLGLGLVNALFHVWLAKVYDKKIVCFPQSVGPLNHKLDYLLTKKILKDVEMFYSREEKTTNLLKKMKMKKVKEISDIGFVLSSIENSFEVDSNKLNLGITVMDWQFARRNSTEDDVTNYLNKLKWVIDELKKKYINLNVYIFPQVTVGEGDSDYFQSKRLYEGLNFEEKHLIDLSKQAKGPEHLVSMYGKMNLFIGSRMHSTIFSLASNTPTVALSYQPKTTGTFNRLGLAEYVYDIKDFNKEHLFETLDGLISGKKQYNFSNLKTAQLEIESEVKKTMINLRNEYV